MKRGRHRRASLKQFSHTSDDDYSKCSCHTYLIRGGSTQIVSTCAEEAVGTGEVLAHDEQKGEYRPEQNVFDKTLH